MRGPESLSIRLRHFIRALRLSFLVAIRELRNIALMSFASDSGQQIVNNHYISTNQNEQPNQSQSQPKFVFKANESETHIKDRNGQHVVDEEKLTQPRVDLNNRVLTAPVVFF